MKSYRYTTMIAALLIASCNLVKAPAVELTGVRVRGLGLRGATILAELSIDNPNKFAIETDSVTFAFDAKNPGREANWSNVTKGTNTERVRIEGGSRTVVEIPIDFAYSALGTPLRSIIERGTVDYRLTGAVFVRKPLRRAVPFDRTGSLSLSGDR